MDRVGQASWILAGWLSTAAAAAAPCTVADPTGTPLNIRTAPNSAIVGTLTNGVAVNTGAATTLNGKAWTYISDASGRPLGWVFRNYVRCSTTTATSGPRPAKRAEKPAAVPEAQPATQDASKSN